MNIGQQLQAERKKAGLTRNEVCEKLNTHCNTIYYIETGKHYSVRVLEKYAELFEKELDISLKERE